VSHVCMYSMYVYVRIGFDWHVLHCVAVCCSALSCSVLQCVVLQCVAYVRIRFDSVSGLHIVIVS